MINASVKFTHFSCKSKKKIFKLNRNYQIFKIWAVQNSNEKKKNTSKNKQTFKVKSCSFYFT